MNAADPAQHARRSMLYRWHQHHGASFVEYGGAIVVARYAADAAELSFAGEFGLCDLSTLPRWGVTGRGATSWLADEGFDVPGDANRATRQENADVLARLSGDEYLLLATGMFADAVPPPGLPGARNNAAGPVYELPRQDSHCCFAVTGRRAAAMLASVCAVDLRDGVFADGAVAQTSVARVSAVVLRNDLGNTACYLVLGGSTAAEYLWDAIAGAMDAPGAGVIGFRALGALVEQET